MSFSSPSWLVRQALLWVVGVSWCTSAATSSLVPSTTTAVATLLQQHLPRRLQDNSFELIIPDFTVTTEVLNADLQIDLRDIRCRDLSIQTVELDLQAPMGNGIPVWLALAGLNITCRADYDYQYRSLFTGGGQVEMTAYETSLQSSVVFVSPNLQDQPPNAVWFNECQSTVQIDALNFDGDGPALVANALNVAGPLIVSLVQDRIGQALCEQIATMEDDLAQLLVQLNQQWEPYWQGTTTAVQEGPVLVDNVPDDALDLQNPSASNLGKIFDLLLDKASEYLSTPDDSGKLHINRLIQDLVVDPATGTYTVDSLDGWLGGTDYATSTPLGLLQVELQAIVIEGLSSAVQRIDQARVVGPYSLQSGVLFTNTTVSVEAQVTLHPLNATNTIVHILNFSLPIERLEVQVTGIVLTSESTLGALALGSLLETKEIVGCVVPGFDQLAIHRLDVSELVLAPTSSFSTSTTWISNIAESNLTIDILNSVLERLLDESQCPPIPDLDGSVDWRDLLLQPDMARDYGASGTEPYGDIGPLLKDYIDEILLETDENGYLGLVENFIYPLTSSQSGIEGVWELSEDLVNIDQEFDLSGVSAHLALRLSDARIENLAAIVPPITILDPIRNEAYRTLNGVTLGKEEEPIRLALTADFGFSADETLVQNKVKIQVEMWDTSVSTTLLLRMAEKYLMSFPLEKLFDIHCLASLLHTPELDARGVRLESSKPSLSLEKLQILLKGFRLDVDCISCSSQEVEEISALLKDPERGRDAARAIQDLIDWALRLADDDSSFLQLQIDRFLVDSAKQCELREEYDANFTEPTYASFEISESSSDDSSVKVLMVMIGVILGIVAIAIGIVTLLRFLVNRRHRAWLESLPHSQLVAIYAAQQAEGEQALEVDKASSSLFESPHVPVFVRYFVPLVLLGNIGLFLSGHFSLGGSVQIYFKLAGEEIVIDDFYKFSIVQSAMELWNAGGVELAILIFLFSGVWPYSKLLITMVLWFAPPTRVSIGRRGSILLWLDTLGKWSMVDVFVMIITFIAFRVTIHSPDYSFLTPDFYRIDLVVAPLWGLYSNLTAQLVTQISSHIIIHYHRKAELASASTDLRHKSSAVTESSLYSTPEDEPEPKVPRGVGQVDDPEGVPTSLQESKFLRPHKGEAEPLYLREAANYLVIVGSTVLIALNLLGYLLPSFSFENMGLVGLAIEFGQNFEAAQTDYSISTIAQLLMEQGRFLGAGKDILGHFSIVALLVSTTLLVPYALIALLLFQLWFPLSSHNRRRVDIVIESFGAWQYVDVYLLSVVVASWQLGDISEYLVNPYCESLDRTFSELVAYGILNEDDAQCFRVRSRVEPAVYTLIVAVVFLSLLSSFVTNAYRQVEYQSGVLARWRERRASIDQDLDLEDKELREKIHPVPLLMSDRFRWLLREGKP